MANHDYYVRDLRAGCIPCGWTGRKCRTEEGARKSGERHVREEADRERRVFQALYGPKQTR